MKTTLDHSRGWGWGLWHMQYHWLLLFGEEVQESALPFFFYFFETHMPLGMPHPIGRASLVSDGKESACNAGDLGSIPGMGRSSGERNGHPLHYSCLGNPMDRSPWGLKGSDTPD